MNSFTLNKKKKRKNIKKSIVYYVYDVELIQQTVPIV